MICDMMFSNHKLYTPMNFNLLLYVHDYTIMYSMCISLHQICVVSYKLCDFLRII